MTGRILTVKPSRRPGEHYTADAAIVWCFDDGWREVLTKLEKARGYKRVDEIKVAGGVKLTTASDAPSMAFILKQINLSLNLHRTKTVILMTHSDCGAYGGLRAFENNPKIERKKHAEYLRAAKAFLREKLPRSVKIETIFADFDGLWTV